MPKVMRSKLLAEESPLIGQACPVCQQPFTAGDDIVVCDEDQVPHHRQCWVANNNHCAALGCTGHGEVSDIVEPMNDQDNYEEQEPETIIIVPGEQTAQDDYQQASQQGNWTSGSTPGGGRFVVYQSNNRGCSRGCSLFFLAASFLMCIVMLLGVYTFFEAIMRFLQGILAGLG